MSLSRFLGLQRSNVGSPEAATVSEICLVNAACFIESDLERGSLILGVGERRSPNFLLAARLIDEKRPSFSGGFSGFSGAGRVTGATGAAGVRGATGAVEGPGTGSGVGRGRFPSR